MDWLEEVSLDDLLNFGADDELNTDFSYKNHSLNNSRELKLTPTAQFFLSLSSDNNQKAQTSIPIASLSETKLNSLIGELAPCYKDCIIQYVSNKPESLILKNPKKEALILLQKIKKNPIVKDLFRLDECINLKLDRQTENSVYRIMNDSIPGYLDEEFDIVYNLLKICFSKDGTILITPRDWVLMDELKESLALRYFVHKCKNVYLWVDKSSNYVEHIQLVFS